MNGRTGSRGTSSPRARLSAAEVDIAGLCTGASCFSASALGASGGRAAAGAATATAVGAGAGGSAGATTRGVVTWAGLLPPGLWPVRGRRRRPCGNRHGLALARHHEDDAIVLRLELAQQFGQRQRGRGLDVVQQHDAFALLIEPGDRAPDHFEGVDVLPVVGDDVGAPGHQAARLQIGFDLLAAQEPGDAEERMGGGGFAQHRSDRSDALLDLALHRVHRSAVETEQMVIAVGADGMALGEGAAGEVGIAAGHPADQEIIGIHAMLGQHVEHAIGVWRQRAVVEGQHDLLVLERQRMGILRRADAGKLSRVHRQHPAGAERVRIARTIIGARLRSRHCAKHQCEQDQRAPDHSRTFGFTPATQHHAVNYRRSYLTRAGTVNATRRANA